MFDKFKRRSYKLEYIDTGNYTPEEYEDCIGELQFVNRWLGDAHSLKATLFPEIESNSLRSFSILDVGAGSGELLRVAATWARETNRGFRGVGLELNERSAESIIEESSGFPEIGSVRGDALKLPFHDSEFDYVMCSLFTHHFVEEQIVQILREMSRVAKRRIFVIDLHRDPIAYFLYTTLGKLILKNRLIRHDGALSILRSFKTEELLELAQRAGLSDIWVERHFPSRLVLSASARKPDIKPRVNADEHKSDLRSSASIRGLNFDVVIAGAGPAGSSAAIHLARNGIRVLLVEQKKFPRAKLCGEFISPECRRHFENLGVSQAMTAAGPTALVETVFYSSRGHHVTIPSRWFGGPAALGLSRAVMDDVLLRRARECGVSVL